METLSPAAVSTLHELKHIVELAAFASEARRILDRISFTAGHTPALAKALSTHTTEYMSWSTYADSCAEVLEDVAVRLGALIDEVQP